MEVDIEKVSFWKAKKQLKTNWKRIYQLPFANAYLQKKIDNSVAFFF